MSWQAFLAAAATILFWASAFPALRFALAAGIQPEDLAILRFSVASLTFVILASFRRLRRPRGAEWWKLALLSLLGMTVYHLALNIGQTTVLAGSAAFIIGAVPIFTTILALVLKHERLTVWMAVGMILGFLGVALVAIGEEAGLAIDTGALWILAAALATSFFFALQRKLVQSLGSLSFMSWVTWLGTLMMLPFGQDLSGAVSHGRVDVWLSVIYLGVLPGAIAYIWWTYALKHAPASQVTAFVYLSPGIATLVAWLWLGEIPTWMSLLGGGLSLVGVIVVQRLGRTQRK